MIISSRYIKPNITIETEIASGKKIFIYNYKGIHYRLFDSFHRLNMFILTGINSWIFECESEKSLIAYMSAMKK